jgi:hypothetical protein
VNREVVTERVITSATDRAARDREELLAKGRAILEELDRRIAENPHEYLPGPKPFSKKPRPSR